MVSNVGQNKVIKEENKMIAIICDRCGSIVEDKIKVTTKDGVVDAARVKLKIELIESEGNTTTLSTDLCPKCAKDFQNWMGKFNENRESKLIAMKLKGILKDFNATVFDDTTCVWDSSFEGLGGLSEFENRIIDSVEIYLKEEEMEEENDKEVDS